MAEQDAFEQAEKLLGRFDFAMQQAIQGEEHRAQLRTVLLEFVEVMDSFDRFLAAIGESDNVSPEQARRWLATFRLVGRQLEQALRRAGVTPLACLGLEAQPGRHEIVGVRDAPGVAPDTIVEETFRGYEWQGDILRKPRVIVARGTDPITQGK
jgi:molecular chaperone GrpE (heat shock protein)